LPALCFVRNPKIQRNQLNELHDLILGRDLGLVSDLKISVSTVKRFLVHLGKNSFRPYNASEVTRVLGLAPQTQKKLLFALESVFLIRRIPVPLRKKEVILFEDQLEEKYYSDGALDRIRYLESAVYRNVRHQFGYRLDKSAQFEHYLTRDHARVPLVIRHESQCLGIIVIEGELPTLSETRQAASFLKNHSNAKILYLAAEAIKPKVIDERTLLCSIYSVI